MGFQKGPRQAALRLGGRSWASRGWEIDRSPGVDGYVASVVGAQEGEGAGACVTL